MKDEEVMKTKERRRSREVEREREREEEEKVKVRCDATSGGCLIGWAVRPGTTAVSSTEYRQCIVLRSRRPELPEV